MFSSLGPCLQLLCIQLFFRHCASSCISSCTFVGRVNSLAFILPCPCFRLPQSWKIYFLTLTGWQCLMLTCLVRQASLHAFVCYARTTLTQMMPFALRAKHLLSLCRCGSCWSRWWPMLSTSLSNTVHALCYQNPAYQWSMSWPRPASCPSPSSCQKQFRLLFRSCPVCLHFLRSWLAFAAVTDCLQSMPTFEAAPSIFLTYTGVFLQALSWSH